MQNARAGRRECAIVIAIVICKLCGVLVEVPFKETTAHRAELHLFSLFFMSSGFAL